MKDAWEHLSSWIARGQLHPVIGRTLPMANVAEAYRLLQEGKNFGKVVVNIL
jgi:NADPH:quinone reductase-like Zn-dependent oxidoreductase